MFGPDGPPVVSTKGVTGHALGAAGALEAAAVVLSIQHELIPPTANTKVIDDDMQIDVVMGEARPWEPGPALSNNFGFGGHNGSIIIGPGCLTPIATTLDDDEHAGRIRWRPAVEQRPAAALAGPGRDPAHLALEDQLVARADLTPEPGAVDPAEQRQLALEALVAQHRERADLSDRLAHQHARQRGAAREVAGEEPLVAGQTASGHVPTRRARSRGSRRRRGTAAGAARTSAGFIATQYATPAHARQGVTVRHASHCECS